ncbi:MAG: hypothetical protein RLZZ50_831, partial [Verrucomicrobiota bacterium]
MTSPAAPIAKPDFSTPSASARVAWALAMAAVVGLSNWLVQYPINPWLTWGAFSYPLAYLVTDVCNRCH